MIGRGKRNVAPAAEFDARRTCEGGGRRDGNPDRDGSYRRHEALAEAEARFMELTGAGFIAAKRLGEGKSEVLRSFDPTAEETLFVPRLQGG
jgi:hypothetical protein